MEVFNSRFSLIRFLLDTVATPYSLPLFCSDPKLPAEEVSMSTLDHFLYVEMTEGEYNMIQPVDVVFSLYQMPAFDPSGNWLRRMQRQIDHLCVQTKTDIAQHTIAIYDYDKLMGTAAIQNFLITGQYPANLQALLDTRPPVLQPYEPQGQATGFRVVPDRRAPRFNVDQAPMEAVWHLTFKFFAQTHS